MERVRGRKHPKTFSSLTPRVESISSMEMFSGNKNGKSEGVTETSSQLLPHMAGDCCLSGFLLKPGLNLYSDGMQGKN